jgi:uncharacterized protein
MGLHSLMKASCTSAIVAAFSAIILALPTFPAGTANVDKLIIRRNYNAAFVVLTMQANTGDAVAQFRLGTLYRLGLGTARDEIAAAGWFARSAKAGNASAVLVLKRMASKTPATPKKPANSINTDRVSTGTGIALDRLPPRPAGQADWITLASARNQDRTLKTLLENLKAADLNKRTGSAIAVAARTSNIQSLAALIAAGGDVNQADVRGVTPLMRAVESRNVDSVDAVLQGKPDLLKADQAGNTAMGLAAKRCQPNIMHILLEAGADFGNIGGVESPLVNTVKYCADWLPFVRFLPAMDTNMTDKRGRSAAWYAAANGNLQALEKLLAAGANPSLPDKDGFTPLHAAAVNGQQDVVRYIISRGGPASPVALDGTTPLMLATYSGCLECMQLFMVNLTNINEKNSHGDTALMYAVRGGHGDLAKRLIDDGANANDDTALKLAKRLQLPELQTLQ